jgi:hypothetical protein
MTTQKIIVVDRDDAALVHHLAAENEIKASELGDLGIEPITTVTFVLFGAVAAVATVAHLVEVHKGGQVIDLRAGVPEAIYRSKGVVYGLVIIIADDGKITVEVKEPKQMFGTVIEALQKIAIELGKAGINSIADSVRKQLGDKVSVNVEHAAELPPARDG